MLSNQFFVLTTLLLPALAAPSSLLTVPKTAKHVPDSYIITLKPGTSRAAHISSIQAKIPSSSGNITHEIAFINAYAGEFSPDALNQLRVNPDVASIEHNAIVKTCDNRTQNDAPWGLARISSQVPLSGSETDLTFEYQYDSNGGNGVDIFFIDSGIDTSNPAFGGRASWGRTFGNYSDQDVFGHGTVCAGIAISGPFGVAKSANAIAVKTFSDDGNAQLLDIILGVDWVAAVAVMTGQPTVVSMSFTCGISVALDNAVQALYAAGITVVAAAGNDGQDAGNSSPAHLQEAITVGASAFNDSMSYTSNFGATVDIFAPGENITSTWIDGQTIILSGTSMASPHVAGFAAYIISMDSSLTPDGVISSIRSQALSGALGGIPSGTANLLLNNGL